MSASVLILTVFHFPCRNGRKALEWTLVPVTYGNAGIAVSEADIKKVLGENPIVTNGNGKIAGTARSVR